MRWCGWLAIVPMMAAMVQAGPDASLTLARDLAATGDHAQAALEFRRLAMESTDPAARGSYFWMAGYEYWKADRPDQAERMLGEAEDAAPGLETEVYLLRAENARKRNRLQEAGFYLGSLTAAARPEPARKLASKRLAAVRLQQKDFEGARRALLAAPAPQDEALAAIAAYEKGRDKSVRLGGLLGLVPGLGYAYAGEYASATRSLLLNALCIWGIVEFAEDETWAGVAVVGFAEITFYTGSIYGGVDATARYNQNRMRSCTRTIEGGAEFHPEPAALPVLSLQFSF